MIEIPELKIESRWLKREGKLNIYIYILLCKKQHVKIVLNKDGR